MGTYITPAPLSYYLLLSVVLFTLGVIGFLKNKNPLIMFMSVEIMLNSANLAFVAFSRYLNAIDGQVIVFFIMTIAAAEILASTCASGPTCSVPSKRMSPPRS